jgi:hypothetical protein
MKTYTLDELKTILKLHKDWFDSKKDGKRADLRGANLRGANLQGANLQRADLRGANLQGANLQWADLRGANLRGADLRGANLQWADLRGANLRGADLRGANLRGANLRGANLQWANLQWADLRGANLRGAYINVSGKKVLCRSSKVATYTGSDYHCIFIGSIIKIGCECHYRSSWEKFSDEEIEKMDGQRALKFWRKEKDIVLKISKNLSK